MASSRLDAPPTPPASIASPASGNLATASRLSSLPVPRHKRLPPGSQKEIALISYLDNQILKITRRYGKKFSDQDGEHDDTPGYTTYDEFVADADPLVDMVWISSTPSLQIPYFLQLAVLACSYLDAFPFTASVFHLTNKIDQAFAAILRAATAADASSGLHPGVNMTEKVRIRSLIMETRVAAVNAATSSGYAARVEDVTDTETEEEDYTTDTSAMEDQAESSQNMSISIALSKVYSRTLDILGDSLIPTVADQPLDENVTMT
jgi:hypothetical protein